MEGNIKKRKNTSIEDTKIFKEYALNAMKKSYLTGAPAVIKSKGTCRTVAKVGILMFCFTGFLWQTCVFLNLYFQYPIVTVTRNIKHMLKPAVTICDKNLISRRYFCEKYPAFCYDPSRKIGNDSSLLEQFCIFFPPYCQNKNDIYLKVPKLLHIIYTKFFYDYNFVKESGFQISECLHVCRWTNVSLQKRIQFPISCSKPSYIRVLNKEKYPGACYTVSFNSNTNSYNADMLNPEANLVMVLKWRNSDLVDIALDILNRQYAEPRKYYISFHDPSRLSNPYFEGISVRDHLHYKVKVSQINIIRLPPPFSSQCIDYKKEWKRNGKKGPLTKEECYQNCHFEEEFKKYGCVSLKVSYPHKEKLCLGKIHFDPELDLKIQTCQERCKDACFETKYLASASLYDNFAARDSLRLLNVSSAVIVRVSFDISNSKEYKDIPKFEAIEIFSYLGSYLSMWLGWCCIAVFDFLEICSRTVLYLCKRMQTTREI